MRSRRDGFEYLKREAPALLALATALTQAMQKETPGAKVSIWFRGERFGDEPVERVTPRIPGVK